MKQAMKPNSLLLQNLHQPSYSPVMKFLDFSLDLQSEFSGGRQNQDCWATPSVTRSETATEKAITGIN